MKTYSSLAVKQRRRAKLRGVYLEVAWHYGKKTWYAEVCLGAEGTWSSGMPWTTLYDDNLNKLFPRVRLAIAELCNPKIKIVRNRLGVLE